MLLSSIREEFVFHCQSRKLSPRTIRNYEKQINYLLRFLHDEHDISAIEDVSPRRIKEFFHNMLKAGQTTNYYLTTHSKVIMLMLIDTGIRLSELTGLTEEQIKYDYIFRTPPHSRITLPQYLSGFFHCQARKLSLRNIRNYEKQVDYLPLAQVLPFGQIILSDGIRSLIATRRKPP